MKSACLLAIGILLTLATGPVFAAGEPVPFGTGDRVFTNIEELRPLLIRPQSTGCAVRLEGVVLWSSPVRNQFMLQDSSGAIQVEMALTDQPRLQVGDRIRLEGQGAAGTGMLREALVDNDGLHSMSEKAGSLYLEAGLTPIRATWFNDRGPFGLEVEYAGPGLARQRISDKMLFRTEVSAAGRTPAPVPGLEYRCFEGHWWRLPNFRRLSPVKTGVAPNFDVLARSRDEEVALEFRGWFQVPQAGWYTFWMGSDDGSQLFVGPPSLRFTLLGSTALPPPRRISPGQVLLERQDYQWAEAEGTVTFVHADLPDTVELELSSGTNRMSLEILDAAGVPPALFSRIRAQGICESIRSAEGLPQADRLVVPGLNRVELLSPPPNLPGAVVTNIVQLRRLSAGQHAFYPVRLQGTVLSASARKNVVALMDATGAALIEADLDGLPLKPSQEILLEGYGFDQGTRLVIQAPPLVDNDGIHAMTERSASVSLTAGKHPFRLSWFNRDSPSGLKVYYEGPGLPRQRIPDKVLFHRLAPAAGEAPRWARGVEYRYYEGYWMRLPDWNQLDPVEEGIATNFDIALAKRADKTGLEFRGYIDLPRAGVYKFSIASDDGSQLSVQEREFGVEVIGTGEVPAPELITASQILREDQRDRWAKVEGTVTFASKEGESLKLELSSGTGRILVEVVDAAGSSPASLLNSRIQATGICRDTYASDGEKVAGLLLAPALKQIEILDQSPAQWSDPHQESKGPKNLPALTRISQVKCLSREEALKGYPVNLHGVVTTSLVGGFFLQDATQAIYVQWPTSDPADLPQVGDYWEVEGITWAEFAPNVRARRAARIGTGALLQPWHPTWDQLINGSMDTLYVEVQGVITGFESNSVALLTRGGKVKIHLTDLQIQELRPCEDSLVRLRGCLTPNRDPDTQQVELGQIQLLNLSVNVDEPAPRDPFEAPLKRASDLLLFDARAGAIQRVRIAGQFLVEHGGEYFLTDGDNGFRFVPKTAVDLRPGDRVEVVGFPELGGSSPVLREAVVRSTGHAGLPAARRLSPEALFDRRHDATRVCLEARLTSFSASPSEQILELQAGTRAFVARMGAGLGSLPPLLAGSRLELAGVYAGLGGDAASGRNIDSFELLLNSPADVRVLEKPSWWTARHALSVLGGMALVVVVALIWIWLLHREVEERTAQLGVEIQRRERTERQRELEGERARIARDLHDDLGASLTEISLLAEAGAGAPPALPKAAQRFHTIQNRARDMVNALDVIVWLVNPRKDALPFLASYLASYAEEYLSSSGIACRLKIPVDLPSVPLTAEVRQCLFLSFKETLHNIVRHSGARQVETQLKVDAAGLEIVISDDGRGFDASAPSQGDGLFNLRQRLAEVGGRCEITTRPEGGTRVSMEMPLPPAPMSHD